MVQAGTRLGPYEITAAIGAGGMGEVYRAKDTKLGRDVAIKVLPAAFTADAERLARFEREAKLLASLNHSNIAHVYGFEAATLDDASRVHFLAMELVPGEDLAERLKRGAIPLEEAVEIAKQIVEALEEAHDHGIVHRDLKPANVKLTPEGKVKVLDFGLAKACAAESATASDADVSHSPTLARTGTQAGVLLGTAAYMSPEQARGKPVDKRADIWAFGVVLYEMLTGRRLFAGETVSDVLAAVLTREPDWNALPAATPVHLRQLLRRCLERNPKNRLHDVADARLAFDEWLRDPLAGEPPSSASPRPFLLGGRWSWVIAGAAGAILTALGAWIVHSFGARGSVADNLPIHFDFEISADDPGEVFQNVTVAISPNGRAVVYVGRPSGSGATLARQLYLRRLDRDAAEPIAGTERAAGPCFSPDGEWIAFFQDGGLFKRRLRGGDPVRLATTNVDIGARGASWGPDNQIVFAPSWFSPLYQVSADGGEARQLTRLAPNEKSHRYPVVLPDGKAALFISSTSDTPTFDEARVEAVDLKTGERKFLIEGGAPRFVPPRTLLVPREGRLLAIAFDPKRLALTGAPIPVLDRLVTTPTFGSPAFDVSAAGDLVYFPGGPELFATRVARVSPGGEVSLFNLPPRQVTSARISPDGRKLLLRIDGANGQLWVFDLERESLTRITRGWDVVFGVWGADAETVYYGLVQGERAALMRLPADGTGQPERLLERRDLQDMQLSSDGQTLFFTDFGERRNMDSFWLRPEAGKPPTLLVGSEANEQRATPSPDGRWVAYVSDESGREEVFLRPFPGPGRRQQISARGGASPFWGPHGRELYFREGKGVLVAALDTATGVPVGRPRLLFTIDDATNDNWMQRDPGGEGFVTVVRDPKWRPADRLAVVLHWRQELEAAIRSGASQ
jgi:serine/threonine-protein kinase